MFESQDSSGIAVVTQDSFRSFAAVPYALLHAAGAGKPRLLHGCVRGALAFSGIPPVQLGVIDLSAVKWTPAMKLYVTLRLESCGLSLDIFGMPPAGYYLFAGGSLLGFHPGTIDFEQDSGPLKFGLAATLFGIFLGNKDVVELGDDIANAKAAARLVEWVKEQVQTHLRRREPGVAPPGASASIPDELLRRAYATLDLTPEASDEEVKTAHRRLVRDHHPDRCARDPVMQKRATLRTAELNAARDVILGRHAN